MRQIFSSSIRHLSAIALLAFAGSFGAASAAPIVNIDLEGYRSAGGGIDSGLPPTTFIGAGAAGGGPVFNGVSPTAFSDNTNSSTTGDNQTYTASALLDSTGAPTSVGLSIGPVGVDNENSNLGVPTDPMALFNDYMFNNSAGNSTNAAFTISGLTPGGIYDVYLYAGFQNVSFISNTTVTGGVIDTPPLTGIYSPANTKVYKVAADASGNIAGTMGAGTNILAGVTVASVPEPASLGLLSLGGLGLLARRRRA